MVIPCYNYARYLPQAIGSARDQSGVNVDVIVVDDCSTDNSVAVAERLAANDDRIKVIRNPRNLGPVATYNAGLALVRGEFSVRLDADDLLTPGSLARSAAAFDRFPSAGLVYGHPVHFESTPPPARTAVRTWTGWPGLQWLERRCRLGVNAITSPEVVMRQSLVDRVGGQRELDHTHDMEMWMRISSVSDVVHIDGPDQAFHREHALSRSEQMVDAYVDLIERRAAFDALFESMDAADPEVARLHRTADRALAISALRRAVQSYDRGRSAAEPIEDLMRFAREVEPDVTFLRHWRALRLRQRIGPERVHRLPPFIACAAARRAKNDFDYWRWSRTGV